jgi:hypothetical protein
LRAPDRADPLLVYAVSGADELREFTTFERPYDGGRDFTATDDFGDRIAVIDGTVPASEQYSLQHVLAAEALGQYLLRRPSWVVTGLGIYLEAVRIKPEEHRVVIGAPVPGLAGWVRSKGHQPVDWMLRADEGTRRPVDLGAAWLLVHLLLDERREQFAGYLARLSRGEAALEAFAAAFPGLTAAQLDERLDAFSKTPELQVGAFELPVYQGTMVARPFSDAELHSARVGLLASAPGASRYRLQDEVDEVLRRDPGDAPSLSRATGLSAGERARRLLAATTLHPDDPRTWLASWAFDAQRLDGFSTDAVGPPQATVLRRALVPGLDPVPGEDRLERAVEAAPENVTALLAWSTALLRQGRAAEALAFAGKARARRPASRLALALEAQALAAAGRCQEALPLQGLLVSLVQLDWEERFVAPSRERLEALQRQCGARR